MIFYTFTSVPSFLWIESKIFYTYTFAPSFLYSLNIWYLHLNSFLHMYTENKILHRNSYQNEDTFTSFPSCLCILKIIYFYHNSFLCTCISELWIWYCHLQSFSPDSHWYPLPHPKRVKNNLGLIKCKKTFRQTTKIILSGLLPGPQGHDIEKN